MDTNYNKLNDVHACVCTRESVLECGRRCVCVQVFLMMNGVKVIDYIVSNYNFDSRQTKFSIECLIKTNNHV